MPSLGARSGVHWHTEKIGKYIGRVSKSTPRIAKEMVDVIGDEMLEQIRLRTPIGQLKLPNPYANKGSGKVDDLVQAAAELGISFVNDPGSLRRSITRSGVKSLIGDASGLRVPQALAQLAGKGKNYTYARNRETTISTSKSYAPYVEWDTGQHQEGGTAYKIAPGMTKVERGVNRLGWLVDGGERKQKRRAAFHIRKPRTPAKKALAFFWDKEGKWVVFAHVMHPGSRGHHMFRDGTAAMTETTMRIATLPVEIGWEAEFALARRKDTP